MTGAGVAIGVWKEGDHVLGILKLTPTDVCTYAQRR